MTKRFIFVVLSFVLIVSTLPSCVSSTQKRIKKQRVVRGVGEAHLAKGSFSRALKYFLEAEALYPDDYLLQDDLGKVYVAKEKYDLAVKHFKKSIALDPGFAPGKNNLGSTYLLRGEWDAAIKVFEELSSDLLYATPHYPMYNLGWAYYNKKDYKKALHYFKKSLKLQRGFVLALRGTGLTYYAADKPKLAIKYLKKAAIKAPKFQQLHYDLANAYVAGKQYKMAAKTFDEVMRIKPDSELSEMAEESKNKLKKR